MTEDKRKYVRIPLSADATLHVVDSPGGIPIQTRVRDISFAGVGLSSPESVDTGTKVAIKIALSDQTEQEVAEGLVAWKIELKNEYDLGIYFSHPISHEGHPRLYGIISSGLDLSTDVPPES